jgi:hypothetical protein
MPIDFMLRYRGPLTSNGSPGEKHQIRLQLHPQLLELTRQEYVFNGAAPDRLGAATIKKKQLEVERPLKAEFFAAEVGGFRIAPIIHRPHELACQLDILFLRREKPGAIVHGGDLDNRLKTLFDALRMPFDPSELGRAVPDTPGQLIYCLLEDDSLITRVNVTTYQLLEPTLSDSQRATDVDLLLHVTVSSTYPMIANAGF